MVTKTIFIEFANPRIKAEDNFEDICEAAEHTKYNLYVRHKIHLETPRITNDGVTVAMNIPDDLAENFNPGYHLRGIASYLLKKHGYFYKDYRVGNRLLYYIEV